MKRFALFAALFIAAGVAAQSQFRQSIRTFNVHGRVARLADGGVSSDFTCSTVEAELVDGGTWPLKHHEAGPVTGSMPNQVILTCARQLEARNGLDGGQ